MAGINLYVGLTDLDWFEFLSTQALDEINFWQPSGRTMFRALQPGELFLFKLHSPNNFIVGGGIFAHSSILPVSIAWDAFGIANGASSLTEMRTRTARYRHEPIDPRLDYSIGCRLLEQPFFFTRNDWIPIPASWAPNTLGNSVGRPEAQSFVGSLVGLGATKGVFVTTSTFSAQAIDFARHLSQRIILISGERMADLMIEHNVGVRTSRAVEFKRIDEDFFSEDE